MGVRGMTQATRGNGQMEYDYVVIEDCLLEKTWSSRTWLHSMPSETIGRAP